MEVSLYKKLYLELIKEGAIKPDILRKSSVEKWFTIILMVSSVVFSFVFLEFTNFSFSKMTNLEYVRDPSWLDYALNGQFLTVIVPSMLLFSCLASLSLLYMNPTLNHIFESYSVYIVQATVSIILLFIFEISWGYILMVDIIDSDNNGLTGYQVFIIAFMLLGIVLIIDVISDLYNSVKVMNRLKANLKIEHKEA